MTTFTSSKARMDYTPSSSCIFCTCSSVTISPREGSTGTPPRRPGRRFVGGAFKPRRARSEITWPAVTPLRCGSSLAACNTSSSMSNVVLMHLMLSHHCIMVKGCSPGKCGQGHPKPPQGHLKATSRPPQGHIVGIDSGVQSHTKATPRLHQGSTKAPTRLPQGSHKAPTRLPQGYPKARATGRNRVFYRVTQRIVSWGRSRDGSEFARGNRSVDTEGFCKTQMTLNSGLRRLRAALRCF